MLGESGRATGCVERLAGSLTVGRSSLAGKEAMAGASVTGP